MAAFPRTDLTPWIAPAGAAAAGIAIAAAFLLMPSDLLETLVWHSGIPSLLPVAQPPLGGTARTILALGGGLLVAAVTWAALFLLFGPGGFLADAVQGAAGAEAAPVRRRADAHPDAPPRKPLSASDLGTPMPPVMAPPPPPPPPVERAIPRDLDQPLAEFHPAAIPQRPREPVRPVAPLRAPALVAGERIDVVELPRAPAANGEEPSIETLLRRLEAGARRPRPVGAR